MKKKTINSKKKNNKNVKKNKNIINRKIIYIFILIICLLLLIIEFAYSFVDNSYRGNNNQYVELKDIDIEYIDGETIRSSGYDLPMIEDDVLTYAPKYLFSVKNNYENSIYIKFKLTNLNVNNNTKAIYDDGNFRYMLYKGKKRIASGTIANYDSESKELTLLTNYQQKGNTTIEYSLYIWIKDTWQDQNHFQNQNIDGKIEVEGYEKELPILSSKIFTNNKVNEIIPDYNNIAITSEGLFKNIDDDGETYYFRGAVDNNYVKIPGLKWKDNLERYVLNGTIYDTYLEVQNACNDYKNLGYENIDICKSNISNKSHKINDDMLWRIVRINGDKSIRLILDTEIGKSKYSDNFDSEEYTGFTYKTRIGYEPEIVDETYKTYELSKQIYISNEFTFDRINGSYTLKNPQLVTYNDCLNNTNLCIDKYSSTVISGIDMQRITKIEKHNSAENIIVSFELYKTKGKPIFDDETNNQSTIKKYLENWYQENMIKYDKIISVSSYCNETSIYKSTGYDGGVHYNTFNIGMYDENPTFKCSYSNRNYGGNYNQKIGLITIDEAKFAGVKNDTKNYNYYLNSGTNFWSNSPYLSYSEDTVNYRSYIFEIGNNIFGNITNNESNVRPVISIKSDVLSLSGDGTKDNPYIVNY